MRLKNGRNILITVALTVSFLQASPRLLIVSGVDTSSLYVLASHIEKGNKEQR